MMTYIAIKGGIGIKAAAVVGGVTDLIQLYNEREDAMKAVLIELIGGTPQEKEEEYKYRSAYYWPEAINVPVLILHGEADDRVNVTQAEKLAKKLDELGKVFQLVTYPNGDHGLNTDRSDRNRRIFNWFSVYLP
jgi:dipeptidyl aminopeptidase/acylaminoacyl peptidase